MIGLIVLALMMVQEPPLEQLIRQLGSEGSDERRQATQELRKRGMAAVPRIREALQDRDAEVANRARELLVFILDDFGQSTLRSFEDAINAAPSLRIASRTPTRKEPRVQFAAEGVLLRKSEGKVRITCDGGVPEEKWSGALISNGESVFVETDVGTAQFRDRGCDGEKYWSTVKETVAKVSSLTSVHIWVYVRRNDLLLKDLFRMGDWKSGEDGNLRTLEYSIEWLGKDALGVPNPSVAKVWYDPKSYRPIKRVLTFSSINEKREILEQFSYDEDISEAVFKLPGGKRE